MKPWKEIPINVKIGAAFFLVAFLCAIGLTVLMVVDGHYFATLLAWFGIGAFFGCAAMDR